MSDGCLADSGFYLGFKYLRKLFLINDTTDGWDFTGSLCNNSPGCGIRGRITSFSCSRSR